MIAQAFTDLPPVPVPVQEQHPTLMLIALIIATSVAAGFILGALFCAGLRRRGLKESYLQGYDDGFAAALMPGAPSIKPQPRQPRSAW